MRPEAMADGNPLFMNCDYFKDQALRDPEDSLDEPISLDELERYAEHERECRSCIEWLIERLDKDTLPPMIRAGRSKRLQRLRTSLTRLINKERNERSARRV